MTAGTKLGPLPAWAWGLVLLGGIAAGLYLRRHSSGSPTASLVSAGSPVDSLGAGGGASDGSGTAGVSTGIDPLFAQMLSDSSSALVNESGVFAGLAAQSVQGALDAAQGALGLAATVATTSPIVYTIGSSPAGSSPTGTTPAAPNATNDPPPSAPVAPRAPFATVTYPTPATVSRAGVLAPAGVTALVDSSGHVVNAKGARVGGRTLDS